MTLEAYLTKLRDARTYIEQAALAKSAEVAGLDMVALIVDRVIQRGENANGSLFSSYSRRPMSPRKLVGKSRRSSAEAKIATYIAQKNLISYADFRELNGLKVDKKNFEFTGEMWRKFGVVASNYRDGVVSLTLDGKTAESKRKLADNSKREKTDIAAPNTAEVNFVQAELEDWVKSILT